MELNLHHSAPLEMPILMILLFTETALITFLLKTMDYKKYSKAF